MVKESFLSKLRSSSTTSSEEEQKLKKELMELKIKHSSGQLRETHKIKEKRREIARFYDELFQDKTKFIKTDYFS